MSLRIEQIEESRRKQRPASDAELAFGRYFTDHMMMWNFSAEQGWHDLRIVPHQPLTLDPASMILHYGQQVFEGLKAYRTAEGGIHLFRYRDHLARLARSAARLCIPAFDQQQFADALRQLVLLDRHWVPESDGCALYVRPTIIATDPFLGVRPSQTYLFYVILSPVGAYYPEGFNPVRIMAHDSYVRAVAGGVGEAKTAGNYAASMLAQLEAKKQGFTQVLWLDGKEHRYVEEVGTMNIFFKIGEEIITSPLTGSILPGVTRDTTITVLRDWGYTVSERALTIDAVLAAAADGSLDEVFGTGTAAVISPVGHIGFRGKTERVGDGLTGELSQRLFDHITALQYGRVPDTHGWVERIDL
ncbi:MAG: branched-chain amino acid aminotransferase [Deltaproteobacteria bacterium]|nr:branched-chain amino acid aminotransferase [Deltaproteobacteria bacterium]